ncbi:MAG: 5-bromo-4-chloroindolyl phosphate hydrolysis family protein [Candidatus Ventricola sp.]
MKAKRLLKKLNYLPRWAWYLASLCVGGPVGPFVVYLVFHVLQKAAEDEVDEARADFDWNVDIDEGGVHVRRERSSGRSRSRSGSYQDEECTVTGDEDVTASWEKTEASARRARAQSARPAQTDRQASAQETADAAGDECSAVIREGREALRSIRHANDLIPDPALSAQIDSIEQSCSQILSILEQRPTLLPQLRTFLRYYLPTTLKLLDARARLEHTANTPKAREVRTRISEALGVIDKAFQRQVEALDEYRFIDLESEMDVLRDMLRSDGLVDDEQEADPFADVLGRTDQRENGAGTPMATH